MKKMTPTICDGRLDRLPLSQTPLLSIRSGSVLLAGVAALLLSQSAHAASTTWTGGSSVDGSWGTGANWSSGSAPGATSGTTSADVATFNTAVGTWGTVGNPVSIDAGRNIQSLIFDGAAGNYIIGSTTGNALVVTASGSIGITNTLTNAANNVVTETINAPLLVNTSLALRNDSANGTAAKAGILIVNGAISGGGGTTTLSLRGSNTNANTVNGVISNGSGTLNINKTDAGTWYLTGLNTYTGYTSIQYGALGINSIADKGVASAIGAGTQIRLGQSGSSSNVGRLLYTGATASSNRDILIYNGATGNGGGIIENATAGTTLTLSGTITSQTPTGGSVLTLQGAGNGVLSGNIVGSPVMALTKAGAGSWTISGTNTSTGVTAITAGTLQFAKEVSLYNATTASWTASNIKVSSGATLALNVGGSGEFTATDVTTLLGMGGSSTTGFMSGSILGLDTTNAGSFLYDAVIANAYTGSTLGLTKLGNGTLVLSAANTYTGATTIASGTLQLGNGGSTGSLSTSGALVNQGTLAFNRSNAVVQGTDFNAVISGTGSLLQLGTSSLTLNGGNTYTGATTIASGVVNAPVIVVSGGTSSLGNATSAVVLGGPSTSGTLNYTGNSATFTRGLAIGAGGGEIDVATAGQTLTVATGGIDVSSGGSVVIGGNGSAVVSSVIGGGSGGVTKTGVGALTLGGANTYTGATTIASGVVHAPVIVVSGGTSSLGNATSAVVLGGAATSGTLDYTGNTATFTRGLTIGAGGGEIDVATAGQTLTIATGGVDLSSGGSLTVAGSGSSVISSTINGSGGLTKSGAGTLTVTGANTYTGVTTISGGMLSINSIGSIGGGASAIGAPVTVQNGTIYLSGILYYTGGAASSDRNFNITGTSNAVINNAGTGTLTLSGTFSGTAAANSGLQIRGTASTLISGLIATGTSALSHSDNGALTVTNDNNSFTGNVIIYNGTVIATSIADQGVNSALGAGTTIILGQNNANSGNGRLIFSGASGGSSNRSFIISNGASGGSGTLENSVAGQTVTLSGNVSAASDTYASLLTLQGVGNGVLSGNIVGNSVNPNLSLTKLGTGTWTLSGSNSYTGTTLVSQGTLALAGTSANNIALSSTIAIANGATLDVTGLANGRIELAANQALSGTGAVGTVAGAIGLNGGNVISSAGVLNTGGMVVQGLGNQIASGTVSGGASMEAGSALAVYGTLSGNLAAQSGATLSGTGSVSGTATVNGGTVNGGGLRLGAAVFTGNSTLSGINTAGSVNVQSGLTALTGTTTTTGTLSVSAGATLSNNGLVNGGVSVAGLLKGSGTINGALELSGTLAPGNSPGTTVINGDFTMTSTATLALEITGTASGAYDQVQVSGAVKLDGTLDLTGLRGLTLGDQLVLIDNTGTGTTSGYFSSIVTDDGTYTMGAASGSYLFSVGGVQYVLDYAAKAGTDSAFNDVTLTVVPEPGTWAMLIGGLGLLVLNQKVRRRC